MNKEAIFQHYSYILDNMLEKSLFFKFFFQNPITIPNINGTIDNIELSENLHINFGISRGCIIDDNYNWVVKFDIAQDIFEDSLCDREVDIFRAARAHNLENYFAEAEFIGIYRYNIKFYDSNLIDKNVDWYDYNPKRFNRLFLEAINKLGEQTNITIFIPLFAYPKAERYCYTYLNQRESNYYKDQAYLIPSPLRKRNVQIAMEFIFRYGMDQYKKLTEFMKDYNINDLHFGNIGNIRGNLTIIDYAGYHSGEVDEEESSCSG